MSSERIGATSRRPGVVLVLALLCIVAIEVTAMAMHFTTVQELRTARSASRDLELRTAARSAVEAVITSWPYELTNALSVRATARVQLSNVPAADDITVSANIERLSTAAFLIRGTAASGSGAVSSIGAIVQMAQPSDVAAGIDAALVTNGDVHAGMGSRIAAAVRQCDTTLVSGTGDPAHAIRHHGAGQLFMEGGEVAGATTRDSLSTTLRVGTVSVDRLLDRLRRNQDTLSMVEFLHGPHAQPSHTAGILVVDGDVVLDGLAFDGLIVVQGSLTLSNGTVRGAVYVDGGHVNIDNATIQFDACSIDAAVHAPVLLGPYRPHSRMWIPLY